MANDVIGKAALVLTVANAALEKGLSNASKSIGSFISGAGSLLAALPLGGIGILLSFDGIKNKAEETINALREQEHAAKRIGVSTESFQGLSFANASLGGNTEGFEKGLEKFQRSISQASIGAKAAVDSFKQLGLAENEIAALKELPLEDALKRVAAGFKNLPSADKIRLAMELFGKGGTQLLPLLAKSGTDIDALIKKAHELGLALNPADQAKASAAGAAMKETGQAWQGLWNSLAVSLSPLFTAIAVGTEKLLPILTSVIKPLLEIAAAFEIAFLGPPLAVATGLLIGIGAVLSPIGDFVWSIVEAFSAVASKLADDLVPVWNDFVDSLSNSEFVKGIKEGWDSFVNSVRESLEKLGLDFSSNQALILSGLSILAQGFSILWDIIRLGAATFLNAFVNPALDSIVRVSEALTKLIDIAAQLPDSLGGKQFKRASEEAHDLTDTINSIAGASLKASNSIGDVKIGGNSDKIKAWFEELKNKGGGAGDALNAGDVNPAHIKLLADIDEFNDKLKEQVANVGKSADEIKLYQFAMEGASDAELALTQSLIKQKDEWEHFLDLLNEGVQLTDSLRTPTEKYQDELDHLDELLHRGAITYETYQRAVKKATDELHKSDVKVELPTFQAKDTEASVNTIIKARLQSQGLDKVADKADAQRAKANDLLKQISDNTKSSAYEETPIIEVV